MSRRVVVNAWIKVIDIRDTLVIAGFTHDDDVTQCSLVGHGGAPWRSNYLTPRILSTAKSVVDSVSASHSHCSRHPSDVYSFDILTALLTLFTALDEMQTRSSDENSVGASIRPSVCLSNACIVIKRKKDLSRFLYHTKDHLAYFSEKKNGW